MVAIAGMDALEFLTTGDEEKRTFMLAIARAAEERMKDMDRNRAVMIANAVGELFKKAR